MFNQDLQRIAAEIMVKAMVEFNDEPGDEMFTELVNRVRVFGFLSNHYQWKDPIIMQVSMNGELDISFDSMPDSEENILDKLMDDEPLQIKLKTFMAKPFPLVNKNVALKAINK